VALQLLLNAGAMSLFSLFGPRTVKIVSPTLGILDLSLGSAAEDVSEDTAAIGEYFSAVKTSSSYTSPLCDVLFIYCDLESDGSVRNSSAHLAKLIRDSHAKIVVVASDNTGVSYAAAATSNGKEPFGKVNVVLTLERGGGRFARFFRDLFGEMQRGTPMPVAWNRLAPQIPGSLHDAPDTIFVPLAGPIAFR
jgi:hypothetical protein